MTDGINTLRYSDIFLAMYFDDGKSCMHRNHSHVWGIERSGFFNDRGKWVKSFENQRV